MENIRILIKIWIKMIKFAMNYKNKIHITILVNKNIKKWQQKIS